MFLKILQSNAILKAPQTGRLNHFVQKWMMFTQDSWVLQTVQGYHIEFMNPPVQHSFPGMPSLSPSQETVVDQEMKVVSQGSHSSNSDSNPIKRGIHKLYVHSPQKGWRQLPSYKFKATKSVPSLRTFQEYVERSFETRRLCCKDRPQGCIPNCTNLERSSKIPAISSEGSTTRICFPPLWVNHSPQGVHKVDETSSSCFKTTGHSCDNLLGRHTNHGRITSLSIAPWSFNFESPRGPRIYSQPRKVPVSSFSRYRIF